MNELIEVTKELQTCDRKDISRQVMNVCRAITPQFYKKMSVEEMKMERASIELLTADIDGATLSEMCCRAIIAYPRERSENPHTYFDMNYILKFYKQSFNFVHCESVILGENARKIEDHFDEIRNVLWQKWLDNGEEKIVGVVYNKPKGEFIQHYYSPKDFEQMQRNTEF